MPIRSKKTLAIHMTKMMTGTQKRFPNGSQVLSFGNVSHTVDEVTGAMQTLVTNRATVETAQNAATVALDVENTALPSLLGLIAAFTKLVRATYGTSADALADFDLTPPRVPAPRTAEEKAIAVAKAEATRIARGTTSAKQKKTVKGNITAKLVVTPGGTPPAHG